MHSDLPAGTPTLDLLCVPAYIVIGEVSVDNAFICLTAVAFRSVLSVSDVECMATKFVMGSFLSVLILEASSLSLIEAATLFFV